jgi:hypothetical protein
MTRSNGSGADRPEGGRGAEPMRSIGGAEQTWAPVRPAKPAAAEQRQGIGATTG